MLNLEAAKKCICLLKNKDNILPLDKKELKTVGVIGPNANNRRALVGNYEGTASEYVTVLEGIQEYLGDDVRVMYSEGCHLCKDRVSGLATANDRIAEARAVAKASDVVIACFGLDPSLEGEEGDEGNEFASGDKPNINLPGIQSEVLRTIYETGTPIILVLLSGSALAVTWEDEHFPAIIQGWYPGAQGGRAIADILFGEANPEGKLPVTFYRTTEELPDFKDYSMKGRTYRYMENEALYPFGYGLSYSDYEISDVSADSDKISVDTNITVNASITNRGERAGAETVQVYVKYIGEDVPNCQLKGLKKVMLNPGETKTVSFTLTPDSFGLYNEEGVKILNSGDYEIYVGTSQPDARSIALTGKTPVCIKASNAADAVVPE